MSDTMHATSNDEYRRWMEAATEIDRRGPDRDGLDSIARLFVSLGVLTLVAGLLLGLG